MAAQAPKTATTAPVPLSGPGTTAPAANVAEVAATEPMDPKEMIDRYWKSAVRLRATIERDLGKVQNAGPDGDTAMAGFTKVEELLKSYRLQSLNIIMSDIRAAAAEDKKVENCLWQTHVNVTKAYRNVIGRLNGPNFAVLKRKVEKQYTGFLATSILFYRTFLLRFCGSYKFRELERVARRVKFDDLPAAAVIPFRDAEPEVLEIVNTSFHRTLICLGDLSRYRALVRSKDRSFETALTYYALANEMMPESGHGYHQSGVIYTGTRNHLEIVYNFYRAMTCDRPHPIARKNLDLEFRDILQPAGGGGAKGSLEAMVKWFVKLHAHYYKGEQFAGREELEHEVDNQFAMALKTGGDAGVNNILLKMILINITAYVAGLKAVNTDYSLEKSDTCQFVLQLNIRTIYTISRLLTEELKDIVQQKPLLATDAAGKNGEERPSKATPAFCRMMPLFRVYMTWLCFYTSDLNNYREHLEPQFGKMCKSLAHTLTLLFELLNQEVLTTTMWLFPEDEETIGMECLNGPELPDGCQLRVNGSNNQTKPPADEVPSAERTVENAAFLRVFDSILCGLRLARESPFPITSPDRTRAFLYVEGVKWPAKASNSPVAEPVAPASVATAVSADSPIKPVHISKEPVRAAPIPVMPPVTDSEDFSDDGEFYQPAAQDPLPANRQPAAVPDALLATSGSEFPVDAQLSKILDGLLAPPERSSRQGRFDQDESSYGMGSRTADEIFGTAAASASPAPGSATSKAFPSLPWNYFVPTAPTDQGLQSTGAMRSPSNGWDSRPGSSGSLKDVHYSMKLNEVFTSGRNPTRRSGSYATSPLGYQASQDWQTQTALANLAIREQQATQVTQAQSNLSAGNSSLLSHNKKPSSLASPSAAWPQYTQSSVPSSHQAKLSPFSSANFSAFDSSLPPVNSPYGVPMAQAQQVYGYQGMSSTGISYPQPSMGYPSTQQSMHASAYSPGLPPGVQKTQGVSGNGAAYELASAVRGDRTQGFPIRSYGPEYYERQTETNAWSNDYGPRSAGTQQTLDGPDLRTVGNNRAVPATSMLAQSSGRAASANWNTKPKPK